MPKDIESLIDEKIQEANLDDSKLEQALQQALHALFDHKESIKNALLSRLEQEYESRRQQDRWDVVTALVHRSRVKELRKYKIQPILDHAPGLFTSSRGFQSIESLSAGNYGKKRTPEGPFFLRSRSEKIPMGPFIGYAGSKSFYYEIVPQYEFIQRERLLYDASVIYRITTPLIFSPYARRAVCFRLLDPIDETDEPIDLALEKNGLTDKLLTDYTLVWNIEISPPYDEVSASEAPRDDGTCVYTYDENIRENTYVIPELQEDLQGLEQIESYKERRSDSSDGKCRIRLISRFQLPKRHRILTLHSYSEETIEKLAEDFFTTKHDDKPLQKQRLRTVGDVNCVLQALRQKGMHGSFVQNAVEQAIRRYDGDNAYQGRADEKLYQSRKKYPLCTVRFCAGEPSVQPFLEDYAEYVLHYLEMRYPEFLWRGVR
ncbi:MAG: hypothetical protein IJU76_15340 [Desulfovibrionaceae bacterium]|nr:hypothetical protein [Desulfovibrionaceae bacterium]